MQPQLPFWQRLLLTIAAMLAACWIVELVWRSIFSFTLPSYAAGFSRRTGRAAVLGIPETPSRLIA